MAFEATKAKVSSDIADNGNNEITAQVLRDCLNDDLIEDLGSAIDGKANLAGGNDFTGDQDINGIVRATKFYGNDFASGAPVVGIKGKGSGQAYVMYTSSTDDTKTLMDFLEVAGHCTVIRLNNDGVRKVQISSSGDSYFDIGNFGIGTTSPSEKLEVAGNIKSSGDIKLDRTKKIIFDTDDNQESTILYNTSNTSLDYSTDSKHRFIDNAGELFTVEANLISLAGSVKTDEITTYNDNTNLELSAHGTGKVYVNDDLGVGTSTPSEKLEVKGRIFINPDVQTIGGEQASAIMFKSKNAPGTATAQARIYSYNAIQDEALMDFQVETSSGNFDTGLRLSTASGKVSAIIPTDLQIAEVISFTGGDRTYADLPSSPSQGMMSYITDASSVSYRGTAAGGGSDIALVFYDGSNWIYH